VSGTNGPLPLLLSEGDSGDAVVDLQLRLAELDLACADPPGSFEHDTARVVAQFQARRGLKVTGACDRPTWSALVEAGYRLGTRLLYRHAPMFRGDDVAELQRRLSALGFDPGPIDGIFGDHTVTALSEFQRNVGVLVDGRAGPETLAQLLTISLREGGTGEQGGFSSAVASICRQLREGGALVLELHDPDPSRQAAAANAANSDCFVGLRILPGRDDCVTAYYSGFAYESVAAKRLAGLIQDRLGPELGLEDGGICGMALPILRETRMPAIEIQLGSPSTVVQHVAELAAVVLRGLGHWFAEGTS
jgi:N-acetylmuramoyl-L-alanine amidase